MKITEFRLNHLVLWDAYNYAHFREKKIEVQKD